MVRGEYRSKTKVVIFSDFIFSVILTCSEVLSVHLFIFIFTHTWSVQHMHLQVIKVDRILHSVMTHLLRPLGEEYISKIYRKFRSDIHLIARVSMLISSTAC